MNEQLLLKRCQQGDKPAFEALLEQHYDTIYRFAYRWCGDQFNAQDITQQACMKLATAIMRFDGRSSFTSWLYRLVINCAKDFYKSPKQYNQREQSDEHINSAAEHIDDRTPERLYAQQILEHINGLQEDLRDTLVLVYGTGLSHTQVAEQLDIKVSTVAWRVHEARKQLKQTFSSSALDSHESVARGSA